MATIINDGWLVITDGSDELRLMFEECKIDIMTNPTIKHYAGGSNTGYTTGKRWLEFKVRNIWLTSSSNFNNFSKYTLSFQDSGTFNIQIKRDSSGNYVTIDDNDDWDVMVKQNGIKDMQKISFGDQQIYQIGLLLLEEAA
ncbi:MAG: hypothetical protein ACFFG0_05610 [Candidatus Thorarchaeota archaeon]